MLRTLWTKYFIFSIASLFVLLENMLCVFCIGIMCLLQNVTVSTVNHVFTFLLCLNTNKPTGKQKHHHNKMHVGLHRYTQYNNGGIATIYRPLLLLIIPKFVKEPDSSFVVYDSCLSGTFEYTWEYSSGFVFVPEEDKSQLVYFSIWNIIFGFSFAC